MIVASAIAVASASLFLTAGYLLGVKRGASGRKELLGRAERAIELEQRIAALSSSAAEAERLRGELLRVTERERVGKEKDAAALEALRGELRSLAVQIQERERTDAALRADLRTEISSLAKKGADANQIERELRRIVVPLLEGQRDTSGLRDMLQQALTPMMQRDNIGRELAQLEGGNSLGELPRLLEGIAQKGGFSTVVLSDDVGLPLAASANATSVDWLAGMASSLLTLVERSERSNQPKPIGFIVHDQSNQLTLHRLFNVGETLFLLTAVSRGRDLRPDALDPALAKLERVLARPDARA